MNAFLDGKGPPCFNSMGGKELQLGKSKHQLQQLKDTVIDRQRATSRVTELTTTARDDWKSWPTRRLSHIAKRLEVSNDLVESLLQPSIDHHLKELGEINVRLD